MRYPTSGSFVPYKSVAAALLFSIVLGPVGLLYGSFWAGLLLIPVGVVVISSKFYFPILLLWITCCVLSVRAVESYNKTLFEKINQTPYA